MRIQIKHLAIINCTLCLIQLSLGFSGLCYFVQYPSSLFENICLKTWVSFVIKLVLDICVPFVCGFIAFATFFSVRTHRRTLINLIIYSFFPQILQFLYSFWLVSIYPETSQYCSDFLNTNSPEILLLIKFNFVISCTIISVAITILFFWLIYTYFYKLIIHPKFILKNTTTTQIEV